MKGKREVALTLDEFFQAQLSGLVPSEYVLKPSNFPGFVLWNMSGKPICGFSHSAGVLAWLLRCSRDGFSKPSHDELFLLKLPPPPLYLESVLVKAKG